MNKKMIPLGRLLGIPVDLDYSWFVIFVLITWSLAVSYYPSEFKDWPAAQYWVLGAITAVLLFVSVLLHELGHSVVALHYQIPVTQISLFIFGGVAQMRSEPPSAKSEFWIAIAGPVVSFALAALFYLLQPAFEPVQQLYALAKYLAYINGMLATFNLIPGFPLDGGRIFRAAVWGLTRNLRQATLTAATVGRFIAFLFIFFGVFQMLAGNVMGGLWIAFIGWFLESAAVAQVQQQVVQGLLTGHKVAEAMSQRYAILAPDTTLQDLVDRHILGAGKRCFLVQREGKLEGLLTLHQIKAVPREAWPETTTSQAMIPLSQIKWVTPETELLEALAEMDRDGVNQLPVIAEGQVQGMLSREDVINYLRTLREFHK